MAALCCVFCDHETVSARLSGVFDCEYCGAEVGSGRKEDEVFDSERARDVGEVSPTPQVQVCRSAATLAEVCGDEPRDGGPPRH